MTPNRPVNVPADLPPRQQQILRLIADGETTKAIALELHISPKTVEFHRMNLMRRTRIFNIAGLTRLALRLGMVFDHSPTDPWPGLRRVQRRD